MSALCPTSLIVVPSEGGISHAPEEDTAAWEDIAIGAEPMLSALTRLTYPVGETSLSAAAG